MMEKQRRKTTRTDLWFDSEAIVKYENKTIKGKIKNLGARGMFLETSQKIPKNTNLDIKITFRTENPLELSDIKGTVIWCGDKGMGIGFTKIELERLRECMSSIMQG